MFKSISAVLRGVTLLAGAGHAVSGFTKGEVFGPLIFILFRLFVIKFKTV